MSKKDKEPKIVDRETCISFHRIGLKYSICDECFKSLQRGVAYVVIWCIFDAINPHTGRPARKMSEVKCLCHKCAKRYNGTTVKNAFRPHEG